MPLLALKPGSVFAGRYQIIEELGEGGMGKVYKVLDADIEEKVALKLLRPDIAGDEETIHRFRNELRLARQISHPHVCRMYDLGQYQGSSYITMEYVSGEDLKSTLRRAGPLSAGKAIVIARQIAEGLAEAHRLGVVHRDLKPHNIMLDREGQVRIMDFGIARSLKAKSGTGRGVLIGTPEYMSPEQAGGQEVDARSDIYSFGIVLFEMLAGVVPFSGDTPLGVALRQKTEPAPDPREFNAQVPLELSRLVLKCLDKDRDKRYQAAGEVLAELARLEPEFPTTEKVRPAKRTTSAAADWRRPNRKKAAAVAALVMAAVLVFVVLWQVLTTTRQRNVRSIAVLPFESAEQTPQSEYFCDGMTESLIGKLAQLSGLKVISSYSVLKYKGQRADLKAVGRDLDVQAVLTGRIARQADNLSVRTELVSVQDSSRLWGEQYNRPAGDVFTIQEDIAGKISQAIQLRLTSDESRLLAKRPTENVEAYKLYVEGRFYWNRRTHEDLVKAIGCFERAVALDPNYALGYASIAETYTVLGTLTFVPSETVFPQAEAFALKAMAIDEDLPEAYTALGEVKMWQHDYPQAEQNYQKAISLNPNYSTAHQWLAELYMAEERYEPALVEIRRAQELDPHAPIMRGIEAQIYMCQGRYDDVIRTLEPVLLEHPYFDVARLFLFHAYSAKKDFDQAWKNAEECRTPNFQAYMKCRWMSLTGKAAEARAALERIVAGEDNIYFEPAMIGVLYADLGDIDEAYRWFRTSLERRSAFPLTLIKMFVPNDRLMQDPRYNEIFRPRAE